MDGVYIYRSGAGDVFKIGKSVDHDKRVKALATGNPEPLTEFAIIETEHASQSLPTIVCSSPPGFGVSAAAFGSPDPGYRTTRPSAGSGRPPMRHHSRRAILDLRVDPARKPLRLHLLLSTTCPLA